MKILFTKENASVAKEYIGRKVFCFYQDEYGPCKIGILENVNESLNTPFEVDINTHKILDQFPIIMYDSDINEIFKSINELIHSKHLNKMIVDEDFNFNYCPICGKKLKKK